MEIIVSEACLFEAQRGGQKGRGVEVTVDMSNDGFTLRLTSEVLGWLIAVMEGVVGAAYMIRKAIRRRRHVNQESTSTATLTSEGEAPRRGPEAGRQQEGDQEPAHFLINLPPRPAPPAYHLETPLTNPMLAAPKATPMLTAPKATPMLAAPKATPMLSGPTATPMLMEPEAIPMFGPTGLLRQKN